MQVAGAMLDAAGRSTRMPWPHPWWTTSATLPPV